MAYTSAVVPVTYHNIGHPSHQCRNCNATMWYEEREEKSKTVVNLTFSLCCQGETRLECTINEVKNRTDAFIDKETSKGIDEQIVASLIQMLDQYSSVAKAFRMARDWCTTHNSVNFHLRLHSERKTTRQYNAPTVSEVAALIVNDFRDGLPTRDIIVNSKDNVPKRVFESHPSYMALQYPLLFPYGEDGFQDKISYIIQQRPNESSTLLKGGCLFQQYLVDAYTAVEEQRLNWTRNNQDTLRVELYHNLCDVVTQGDTSAVGLGQKSHDRPEIGTRVFKIKLTELLDDLTKKHVFGESRGVVYVIEFQKRGLPHTHILLWLEEHCKCKTPSDIDNIISAELPSPTDYPDAYKTVTDYMLHRPCGKDAKTQHVQPMGNVQNIFQNNFRQKPSLMKKATHIIEEGTIRSKAIKYLFKYLNKGPDRATIVVEENVKNGTTVVREKVLEVDEIKNYLNCRFLAPYEAVWRLFSFDIHYSYPTVMQLSFHLPNQKAITLRDSEKLPALLRKEGIDVTMFTNWFELNKRDPTARDHTYAEIPEHYVWHEKDKL
ncbi:DNA helicase PIF1, ATP-dependent [Tanacetum coccineum]